MTGVAEPGLAPLALRIRDLAGVHQHRHPQFGRPLHHRPLCRVADDVLVIQLDPRHAPLDDAALHLLERCGGVSGIHKAEPQKAIRHAHRLQNRVVGRPHLIRCRGVARQGNRNAKTVDAELLPLRQQSLRVIDVERLARAGGLPPSGSPHVIVDVDPFGLSPRSFSLHQILSFPDQRTFSFRSALRPDASSVRRMVQSPGKSFSAMSSSRESSPSLAP